MARNQPHNPVMERGLPSSPEAERLVLGSLMVNRDLFAKIAGSIKTEHFSLEKHQRIFRRMGEIHERGEVIDGMTLANELMRFGELESVDGLTYLSSLDNGLPQLPNVDGYVRIIRDKADLRRLIATGQQLMNAGITGEDPPEKIARKAAEEVSRISAGMASAKTSYTFAERVQESGGLDTFLSPRKDGLPTGYPYLDRIICGIESGLLYVIGGDSSDGKSSLAGNMALNITFGYTGSEWAGKSAPVGFFSFEMSDTALFTRMLCSRAKVSSWRLKKGYIQDQERRALRFAASELAGAPLYIDASKGLGIKDLRPRIHRMKLDHGIKVAMFDYLQLINWQADGLRSEYEGVTYITRNMAEIAYAENIAMVALTQFHQEYSRRKDKTQRPTLDAMHGSGAIKKDADVVMLLYPRRLCMPSITEEKNRFELIIAKQRDGRRGIVFLDFKGEWTTFVESPEDVQPEKEEQ